MFKFKFISKFPEWSSEDIAYYRKLRDKSVCQLAICTTPLDQFNKTQKRLLANVFRKNLILGHDLDEKNSHIYKINAKTVNLVMSKEIEKEFFSEVQFSGMWDFVFLSETKIVDFVGLLNDFDSVSADWLKSPFVIATMEKIYDDRGPSETLIVSKTKIDS